MTAGLVVAAPALAADDDAAVASIGAVSIKQQEVERLLRAMPGAQLDAVKNDRNGIESWLRRRLASEALLQEARSKGWSKRPEIAARIDAAVREATDRIVAASYLDAVAQVSAGYPSDADVRAAYERAKQGLQVPPTYHIAQIFLAAQAGDEAAVAKAKSRAQELAAQARTADFADLARKNSQDEKTAAHGGDVGTMPLAQLLPEMRDAVARLQQGQVSEPIQSPSGFHILKLIESHTARTATFDEAQPRLRLLLKRQRQQELVDAYLAKMAPAGEVKIDSAALDAAIGKVAPAK